MSFASLLKQAAQRIADALVLDSASAMIEARALLSNAFSVDRAWLVAHSNDFPDPEGLPKFEAMLRRRLNGEPIAYIVGHKEFYGLDFRVDETVLIPRPETELLVDLALERIPEKGKFSVLDLGTGSGAVAISIARQRKNALVTALDRSLSALALAKRNAEGSGNMRFIESDWFDALGGERFDLVVSNPPYIAEGDAHLDALRFEPLLALTSGKDGLDAIRRIVADTPSHLEPGGWLLFEHGYDQGEACRNLLSGPFCEILSWRDLSGIERVSGGRLTSG